MSEISVNTGRFEYVAFDDQAKDDQREAKLIAVCFESFIERLPGGRAQALALTALEECYMWIGKAIRDEQIARTGTAG